MVCFDTDGDDERDTCGGEGTLFNISGYLFKLSYIKPTENRIYLSFQPPYSFIDFVPSDPLKPRDNDMNKTLLITNESQLPVAILNGKERIQTVWIADFTEGKTLSELYALGDDYEMLLTSLVFSLAPIRSVEEGIKKVKVYSTSYVNTMNRDMYEVYSIDIGISYPYLP